MSYVQLMEFEFESNFCFELVEWGWLYENNGKFSGWDVGLVMVLVDLLYWLVMQYLDEYEKVVFSDFVGEQCIDVECKLFDYVIKELVKMMWMDLIIGYLVGGFLGVLCKGFFYVQIGCFIVKFGLMMVFFLVNFKLIEVVEVVVVVWLWVLCQVCFDMKMNESIDVVFLVNGLLIIMFEFKIDNMQMVNYVICQYKEDCKFGKN